MLTNTDRWTVFLRDHLRCVYCGYQATILTSQNLAVDHKTPVSRGGSDAMWNLQTTCTTCNQQKGDKTDAEYRAFLRVRKRVIGF